MLKKLFVLLFKLVAEPTVTWKWLAERQDDKDNKYFYMNYFFPVIGIIALLSFISVLTSHSFDIYILQRALKIVIKQVITYGGSFYIISWFLSEYGFPYFGLQIDKRAAERFTGYALSLIYLIAMTRTLFPNLFFLKIAVFYTIYILWTGAVYFLKIAENGWIKFTIFAGIIVLSVPTLINQLIDFLMPGMK